MRVVIAFGMEKVEFKNYSQYLLKAKTASNKNHFFNACALAALFIFIYLAYAYSFYMGSVYVEKQFWNHGRDRPYSGGDAIGVFFAMIIGLFSISMVNNQFKATVEAKVAAKLIFEVIKRTPPIELDDPRAEKHTLKGEVEFKGVSFYYPSRPDTKVLSDFNAVFEKGKTTALVGPSGSGKSSIVQLVERFYSPEEGKVLIDGKDLSSLNLNHFRN